MTREIVRITWMSLVVALAFLHAPAATAQPSGCTVSLQPSAPSPQLVGERIVWTATAANCGAAPVYQFSVADRAEGKDARSRSTSRTPPIRDGAGLQPRQLVRLGADAGGRLRGQGPVKDGFDAGQATSTVVSDAVSSRVTGEDAVVTPTLNPLVALYSAPPCEHGDIRVRFRPANGPPDAPWTSTNTLPLRAGQSRNFVVAGMLANTTYEMVHRGRRGRTPPYAPALHDRGRRPRR